MRKNLMVVNQVQMQSKVHSNAGSINGKPAAASWIDPDLPEEPSRLSCNQHIVENCYESRIAQHVRTLKNGLRYSIWRGQSHSMSLRLVCPLFAVSRLYASSPGVS